MQDLLSANMMAIVEKRCEEATGEMRDKSAELLHMARLMMTSAYPVQTDKCFESRHSGEPQSAYDITWIPIFHLEPFQVAYRASLGLPEHDWLENLMEQDVLRRIRSRAFDVPLYFAKLLTPGVWDELEEGYRHGQCNIARAIVNSAIRVGADPATRKPRPFDDNLVLQDLLNRKPQWADPHLQPLGGRDEDLAMMEDPKVQTIGTVGG